MNLCWIPHILLHRLARLYIFCFGHYGEILSNADENLQPMKNSRSVCHLKRTKLCPDHVICLTWYEDKHFLLTTELLEESECFRKATIG